MPDPKRSRCEPRAPRVRPEPPPLDDVAEAGLHLDPQSPVARFLRSVPCVEGRMRRLEALRYLDELGASADEPAVIPITERERATARRCGVGERTIRRWRTGH